MLTLTVRNVEMAGRAVSLPRGGRAVFDADGLAYGLPQDCGLFDLEGRALIPGYELVAGAPAVETLQPGHLVQPVGPTVVCLAPAEYANHKLSCPDGRTIAVFTAAALAVVPDTCGLDQLPGFRFLTPEEAARYVPDQLQAVTQLQAARSRAQEVAPRLEVPRPEEKLPGVPGAPEPPQPYQGPAPERLTETGTQPEVTPERSRAELAEAQRLAESVRAGDLIRDAEEAAQRAQDEQRKAEARDLIERGEEPPLVPAATPAPESATAHLPQEQAAVLEGSAGLPCPHCGGAFRGKGALAAHMKRCQSAQAAATGSAPATVPASPEIVAAPVEAAAPENSAAQAEAEALAAAAAAETA